jgi:hypothetical protein
VTLMLERSRCDLRVVSRTCAALPFRTRDAGAAAALAPSTAEAPSGAASWRVAGASAASGRLRIRRVLLGQLALPAGLLAFTRQPSSCPASASCRT